MIISTPLTTDALVRALLVMTRTPHILAYLEANDPQALRQAREALLLAGVDVEGV